MLRQRSLKPYIHAQRCQESLISRLAAVCETTRGSHKVLLWQFFEDAKTELRHNPRSLRLLSNKHTRVCQLHTRVHTRVRQRRTDIFRSIEYIVEVSEVKPQ